MNASGIISMVIVGLGLHSSTFTINKQERIKTMNQSHVSNDWISTVKEQINRTTNWQFKTQNCTGQELIIQWHAANILSSQLAEFKKIVADMAAESTAAVEVQFLQKYPEAVHQEMFLKPCEPLFAQGAHHVDWALVKQTIEATIKQFYCADITKFGEQVINNLINDLYFFASITDQKSGDLLGFAMLAITPALESGNIKLINLVVKPTEQSKELEQLLLGSLFKIINPIRIFTAVRLTNEYALNTLRACGFTQDTNPKQDPNHKLNLDYFMMMEYKTNQSTILQESARFLQ